MSDEPYYAEHLTEQERLFAERFALNANYRLAATQSGWPAQHAGRIGAKVIRNPLVRALVAEHRDTMKTQYHELCKAIVGQLASIAGSDLRDGFSRDGKVLPPHEWPDDFAQAVSSIECVERKTLDGDTETTYKIRLWNKNDAVDKLAKILSMYSEDAFQKKVEAQAAMSVEPGARTPRLNVLFTTPNTTTIEEKPSVREDD